MKLALNSERWIQAVLPRPHARMRLVCFPHAGGGASVFRAWPSLLPGDIAACLIQLPGRENRLDEPPFSRLAPLVETLAGVLEPVLTMPFALFGHSMGALVAYELARFLRAAGRPTPVRLLVAGRAAPQTPDDQPPIHELSDEDLFVELQHLNGTAPEVLKEVELMRLMAPLLRADLSVCHTYGSAPQKPLACPISAFAGTGDPAAPPARMAAWREQTISSFRLHTLDGDHFFPHTNAAALVARVSQDLGGSDGR